MSPHQVVPGRDADGPAQKTETETSAWRVWYERLGFHSDLKGQFAGFVSRLALLRHIDQTTANILASKYYIFPINHLPHRPP